MGRYGITVALAALVVVAAGCTDGDTSAPRPTGAPPTTAAPTTVAPTTTQSSAGTGAGATPRTTDAPPAPTGVPYDPDVRCTDRVNYVGDPRSNAEINSIGERTGTCPVPQR